MRGPAVLLLLALVALLPAAQAGIVLGTERFEPQGLIIPDGPGSKLFLPVTVSCTTTDAWNPADMGATLTVAPAIPVGFSLEGALEVEVPANACRGPLSEAWNKDLEFTIKADGAVPGLRTRTLWLNLSLPANGAAPAFTASKTLPLKADFLAKVDARLLNATVQSSHAQASFLVQLTNRGNAPATVTIFGPDPPLKGLVVRLPAPASLDLAGGLGASSTVPILMDLGKEVAAATKVPLRIQVSATEDRSRSAPLFVLEGTVLLGGDGTEETSKPSPPLPILFAVGVLVLAAWRRRDA